MQTTEKRRGPRFDVPDFPGNLVFSMDVDVVNMSLSGMAIETTARVEMGRSYDLRLKHASGEIPLAGRVVWCHLDRTRRTNSGDVVPVYRSGIQFQGVLTEKAAELRRFLQQNVDSRTDKRACGRFPLAMRDVVDLDCEYPFVVKRLGLYGMLIETDLAPDLDSVLDMEWSIEGAHLHTKGRVAFVQEVREAEEELPLAHIGIEFLDMEGEEKQALQKVLKSAAS